MKTTWEKFRRGDHLSDEELKQLIDQTEKALPFLRDGGALFRLVHREAITNLETLKEFLHNRKKND